MNHRKMARRMGIYCPNALRIPTIIPPETPDDETIDQSTMPPRITSIIDSQLENRIEEDNDHTTMLQDTIELTNLDSQLPNPRRRIIDSSSCDDAFTYTCDPIRTKNQHPGNHKKRSSANAIVNDNVSTAASLAVQELFMEKLEEDRDFALKALKKIPMDLIQKFSSDSLSISDVITKRARTGIDASRKNESQDECFAQLEGEKPAIKDQESRLLKVVEKLQQTYESTEKKKKKTYESIDTTLKLILKNQISSKRSFDQLNESQDSTPNACDESFSFSSLLNDDVYQTLLE